MVGSIEQHGQQTNKLNIFTFKIKNATILQMPIFFTDLKIKLNMLTVISQLIITF
ncbi:hypothetical protein CRENPOLYSF1_670015 [Crenothrix polyspora]|uniref:Uncharacterized protein n=1 Tax=Crenothrix polyspora TaxID=360316 RepID=A0A1R4HGD6_9GAMM|nr:hypothetical protein CRENPOLYSF1_670015 [Crenothrix polyspora]